MIRLTYYTGEDVYVNPNRIVYIIHRNVGDTTLVYSGGEIRVSETPEQIMSEIAFMKEREK